MQKTLWHKCKHHFSVLGILIFQFSSPIAQNRLDIKTCIIDEVMASKVAKTTKDYNLNGPVRKVTEMDENGRDTIMVLIFNEIGQIIFEKKHKQSVTKTYTYEQGHLVTLKTNQNQWKETDLMTFGKDGYLKIRESKNNELCFTSQYTFNHDYSEIRVNYVYHNDISLYDVVVEENYVLAYNEGGDIREVRHMQRHPENTYGRRQTFSYDPASGFLESVRFVDDCALTVGCNSCLNLHLIITRDKCGQIVSETLSDYTVRNATWSYGYVKHFKRNERNEIVKSEEIKTGMQVDVLLQKSAFSGFETYPYTDYLYDNRGNWNQKINLISANGASPIGYREIQYWE